jgi:hypothetical protein
MADDLTSFMRELKEAADALKQMVKDARDVRAALTGSSSGGFGIGNSGKTMMEQSSFGRMGMTSPSLEERRAKFGEEHDPNRRGVRIASAKFSGIEGDDERIGLKSSATARMSGGVFRTMGMGDLRVSADGGLTSADIARNNELANTAKNNSFNRSFLGRGMNFAQGNYRDALTGRGDGANRQFFGSLPSHTQNVIMSAMPTPQDSLKLMSGIQNSMNTFLPDVSEAMGRATGYYGATLAGGNRLSRGQTIAATFDPLNKIGGISSVGSDAEVAQLLALRGMTASNDTNSTYGQTMRTVGHAARYLNIDNVTSAASVERLTSGQGAGAMLKNFGIYTADLATGKEKTQGQIFEELAQRLTAGRRGATVEQTQASIRRGALGATINSFFEGDEAGAQMFKQYMVDRAKPGGQLMDLSNENAMTSLYGSMFGGGQYGTNRNPLNAQLSQTSAQTEALGMAQDEYIKGIEAATFMLSNLARAAGTMATVMGMPSAMVQNMMGNRQVQGMVSGATAVTDYASKGIAGILEAIIGGEYDTPWGAGVSTATVGMIAGGMAVGAAPALGSLAAQALLGIGSKLTPTGSGRGNGGSTRANGTGGTSTGTTIPQFSDPTTTRQLNAGGGYLAGTHNGYDFRAPIGQAVFAAYNGKVVASKDGDGGAGNHIIINHGNIGGKTVYTHYYHLNKRLVGSDAEVTAGQRIGLSGDSGSGITGAHLHFAVAENGAYSYVNPGKYVTGIGGGGVYANSGKTVPSASGAGQSRASGSNSTSPASSSQSGSTTGWGAENDAIVANATSLLGQATPNAQTQSMINALTGLSSGNPDSIRAAISSLSSGMGVSLSAGNYTGAYTSALGANVGANTAAALVGRQTASTGSRTVNVNLTLPNASVSEAERFAILVKQYLEDDTLQSNTAGR